MASFRPVLVLGLALAACVPAWCVAPRVRLGRVPIRRLPAMRVRIAGAMSVNFLSAADTASIQGAQGFGVLNLGTVSYAGPVATRGVHIRHQPSGFDVETSLVLRIGSQAPAGGTAMVRAWLQSLVNPYRIFLDGVPLSQHPVCVDAHVPVGVDTRHQLKILVPFDTSESESKLQTEISLQVVSN